MNFGRENNDSYLSDLRDRNERAELEVLTARAADLPSLMDAGDLTVSQMLILTELILNTRAVAENVKADAARQRVSGLFERLAEKRGNSATYPVADEPDDEPDDEDESDNKAEALKYLRAALSGDPYVQTVNGPIRQSEIPRDSDGKIDPLWIAQNCTCDEHSKDRAVQASAGFDDDRPGLYV